MPIGRLIQNTQRQGDIDEEPAEHRAAKVDDGEDGGDIGLVAAALARRDDVGDGRMRHRDEPAAAEPLHARGRGSAAHAFRRCRR